MRSRLVVLFALALASVPSFAFADDTGACIESAEKAQKLRRDKKLTEARPELLTCSRDVCPQQIRNDCTRWLSDIDTAMSTVVVRARDAEGKDVIDVKVYVDGQLLMPKLQGTAVPVDPGQHKFRYELPSGKSVEDDVLIVEGEKDRVLRVALPTEAPTTGGGTETPAVTTKSGPGPVPWIIGGIGLASLIGFGIVEIPIQSQYSDLVNGCGKTKSCTQAQEDSLTSLYAPAGVLLGVGIVGVVVGVTWLIVSAVTGHKTPAATAGFAPLPGGGVGTFGASF
ncbi:MAG TPA: hypothetical protein VGH28_06155 [Polyangiaceae bacterium]|jgi:hypothetical protein